MDRDACAFMRVLMRFLARHPSLRDNPVVLVGESYGGARSILMLRHLYQYATLTQPTNSYQDAQLSLEITEYFISVFGTPTPTFTQLNERFNREVLIQPAVAGQEQLDHAGGFDPVANCMSDGCWQSDLDVDSRCDPYNCDWSPAYADSLSDQVNERLNTVGE